MKDALVVAKEFFDLPVEEKERFYSEDPNLISCVVKTSIDFPKEKFHFWRDTLRHRTHPLEDHIHRWPENPARYRYILLQVLTADKISRLHTRRHCVFTGGENLETY